MARKRVDPDNPYPSSTGKVKNVRADQSNWRTRLQQSRIKFDDDQKEIYLASIAEHSRKGDAASAAGVSSGTVDKHRQNDPEFAEQELQALKRYRDKLVTHIQKLALEGEEIKRYDKEGNLIEERRVYPIRLIEMEAKRVEPEYRDKQSIDIGGSGGGVLLVPQGMSSEDFKKSLASGRFEKPKPV